MSCAEITNSTAAIDFQVFILSNGGAICLAFRSTGNAVLASVPASSISVLHPVALRWWGISVVPADAIRLRVQSMQRSVGGLQIPRLLQSWGWSELHSLADAYEESPYCSIVSRIICCGNFACLYWFYFAIIFVYLCPFFSFVLILLH